jgi:hypothetical protein
MANVTSTEVRPLDGAVATAHYRWNRSNQANKWRVNSVKVKSSTHIVADTGGQVRYFINRGRMSRGSPNE